MPKAPKQPARPRGKPLEFPMIVPGSKDLLLLNLSKTKGRFIQSAVDYIQEDVELISELPLIFDIPSEPRDTYDRRAEACVRRLPADKKRGFFNLHHNGSDDIKHLMALNCFAGCGPRGEAGRTVYHWISLFNHACRPNCHFSFDKRTGRANIRTLVPIPNAGTELTIDYDPTDGFSSVADRQVDILRRWNFSCDCSACTNAEATTSMREKLLQQQKAMKLHLEKEVPTRKILEKDLHSYIAGMKQEHFFFDLPQFYDRAADVYRVDDGERQSRGGG
ncbi:hypothetical protein EJ08DRAFT_720089 [Tothia fuscella]|uniref:SET domain-containing protein n=1 Tax=Tothia fuscella TaxID=1048955 RepID=A0A9P4NMS2_9PEZI|nr:hypothetical protein EJ08DRAFT_720089 [Tothia fuscella]